MRQKDGCRRNQELAMEQGRVREGTPPDEEAGPPGSCYMPTLLVSIARGVGRILSCVGRLRWYSKVYFSSEKKTIFPPQLSRKFIFSHSTSKPHKSPPFNFSNHALYLSAVSKVILLQ